MSSKKKERKRRNRASLKKKQGRQERNNNKKKKGMMMVSHCPEHGPYTAQNLCACYDENGLRGGMTYDQWVKSTYSNPANLEELMICPEHGEYTKEDLCACYEKGGSRWGKRLPDEISAEDILENLNDIIAGKYT